MQNVYVSSACRTPIGKIAGSLSEINDVKLISLAMRELIKRSDINVNDISEVYVGCCFPEEQYNLGRKAVIQAGLPYHIPASTINKTCCSSLEALVQGVREIQAGDADYVLVGGVENMSRSPHVMKNAIKKARMLAKGEFINFEDVHGNLIDDIGVAVELSAKKYGYSKKQQDRVAYESHRKARIAQESGKFIAEIFEVVIPGSNEKFVKDETINYDINLEEMEKENPLFIKGGTITVSNTSPINDGAAALLLVSEKEVKNRGISVMARITANACVGVNPDEMIFAPAYAIQKLLAEKKMKLQDIDLIECSEAYAAQVIGTKSILQWEDQKVNVNGGSIALGHPLGCSGLRMCTTLVHTMLRDNYSNGIVSMCAGGGMGQAVMFERS